MASRKRTRGERESDLVLVSSLYLQGWTHQAITDGLNAERHYQLCRSQVTRDIKTIHARWRETCLLDFHEAQLRELARIDLLERQFWQAWERSQGDSVSSEVTNTQDEMSGGQYYRRKKIVQKAAKQFGQAAYLQGVQWCIEQRCKILGLNAPSMVSINWRLEARAAGVDDPDALLDKLVEKFIQDFENGRRGSE